MTTIIGVRFRNVGKVYYFSPKDLDISVGDHVIVETARGVEYGFVVLGPKEVDDSKVIQPLKEVIRIATPKDDAREENNRKKEKEAFVICQKKIRAHELEMKLIDAEYTFDNNKVLFYFTADGRIDFRELVKDLAGVFRSRIELRQIGVRDEAKMLGGLGICGRPFCCSQFMDEFIPVSIKMAKTQNLSLNPTKISGTCGRLMCCLKYEQDAYEDALKRLPKQDSFVVTPDGPGNVSDVNVLKETVHVKLDDRNESPRCYHNCEVCVLRNGKGSRDGIEIPSELPERYVEQREEEEIPVPSIIADFSAAQPQSAPAAEENGERHRRRSRGHRGGRGKGGENAQPQATQPKAAESSRPEAPKEDKPEKSKSGNRRRRGGRGGKPADKDAAPKQPAQPKTSASKQESAPGSEVKKKPRHRGGRRHHGGHSGSTPAES